MSSNASNVQVDVKGQKLILTIDISDATKAAAPRSASGKTRVVASSHGNMEVAQAGVIVGLNVFFK